MRIIIYFMVKLIKICKRMSRVWKSGLVDARSFFTRWDTEFDGNTTTVTVHIRRLRENDFLIRTLELYPLFIYKAN